MQQFINWGGETPEQLAERRRFEEEMREFMINKMLMEAARAQGKSASATAAIGGGGGGVVEVTDQSAIMVYYDVNTNTYAYFTMNPASLTFSEPVDTGIIEANIDNVYPLNQKGFAIVFNNFDSSRTVVLVSAKGEEIERFTTLPTFDFSRGVTDGQVFYCTDYDARTIWVFDGTSLRKDETILVDSGSFNIGTDYFWSTYGSTLIVQVVKFSEERGSYREWWAVNTTSSTLILTDYYDESGYVAQVFASYKSRYVLVNYYNAQTGYSASKAIYDIEGNQVWFEEFEALDEFNYWFYGLGESIMMMFRVGDDYLIRSFDPTISLEVESYTYTRPNGNIGYEVRSEDAQPWSNRDNSPANTFAILFYESTGNQVAGNVISVANALMITKFQGKALNATELTDPYISTSGFAISDSAVLLPAAVQEEDLTYKIRLATASSVFDSFVNSISFPYGEGSIYALNFDRAANGFLLQIAYSPAMSSFIFFITNEGIVPEAGPLVLEGVPYSDAGTNWFSESGPLLYYSPLGIHAWLPDLKEWQLVNSSREGYRYSTNNYYNPGLKDGSNYCLIKPASRLFWFTDNGSNNISDGGNDMYDGGNNLYGGSDEYQIPYTHTQSSQSDELTSLTDFAMDGTVESGASYELGQGSEYFTNLYPGLFVLSALNVETDRFVIDGDLGSDGGGQADFGKTELSTPGYWLFYKRVWGASDPSVNQLIIVKATDDVAVIHEADLSTNDERHVITNLVTAGVTQIHYLLFALAEGAQASLQDMSNLANTYVSLIKNETSASDIKDLLATSYSTLLQNVPARIPTGDLSGTIVSPSEIKPFGIRFSNLDRVELGETGLLIVSVDSNRSNQISIDHYTLDGVSTASIETDFDSIDFVEYNNDRAIVMVSRNIEGTIERAIFIFNGRGYTRKDFNPTEGYNFVINDVVWWD